MSEGLTTKELLARVDRKLIATIDVGGVPLQVRRPSHKERIACAALAKKETAADAGDETERSEAGLRAIARMAAYVLFDPKKPGVRVYDPKVAADVDTLAEAPWLEDVQSHVLSAFKPTDASLKEDIEEAKGKS